MESQPMPCPVCGRTLQVPPDQIGLTCPNCHTDMVVEYPDEGGLSLVPFSPAPVTVAARPRGNGPRVALVIVLLVLLLLAIIAGGFLAGQHDEQLSATATMASQQTTTAQAAQTARAAQATSTARTAAAASATAQALATEQALATAAAEATAQALATASAEAELQAQAEATAAAEATQVLLAQAATATAQVPTATPRPSIPTTRGELVSWVRQTPVNGSLSVSIDQNGWINTVVHMYGGGSTITRGRDIARDLAAAVFGQNVPVSGIFQTIYEPGSNEVGLYLTLGWDVARQKPASYWTTRKPSGYDFTMWVKQQAFERSFLPGSERARILGTFVP